MNSVLSSLVFCGVFVASTSLLRPVALAQNKEISRLEQQNKLVIGKAYAASVRIWGYDTVRKAQNSSQFSGVVVNKDGTILTVSHAIQPNRTYKVHFPDGREALAVALGKMGLPEMQSRPDLGMMKLITKGDWPVAEMGWSYSLKVNQPCISISYPETLNQPLPTVRFGKINNILNEWGFIDSSCKMEPGDSGGPLFDGFGRVIGMHSRCEQSENQNYEVPIDLYRKYWTALTVAEDYKTIPVDTNEIKKDQLSEKILPAPILEDLPKAFTDAASLNGSVVSLQSTKNGLIQSACATVFEDMGNTFLVSKSSIVADDVRLAINKQNVNVKILARDEQRDLVLLSVSAKTGKPISLKSLRSADAPGKQDLGTFLISPMNGTRKISVLSSMLFDLPRKFSAGYIGAFANFMEGKATVRRTAPGGPASEAGIQPGDNILKINGIAITSAEIYNAEMQKSFPGDTLQIGLDRNGSSQMLEIVAIQRPPSTHTADKFEGGKSIRLDDFRNVFAHDAIVEPDECGGPVFDRNGKFYGLNIARFSRTSTIVMPSIQIIQFIKEFTSNYKSE